MPTHGPVVVVLEKVDSYQAQLVNGVRAALAHTSVPVLFYLTGVRHGIPESLTRLLISGGAGGLLLTASSNPESYSQLQALAAAVPGLPVVRIGMPGAGVGVHCDNREAMHLVAHHLVAECGARRVLAIRGFLYHRDSVEREAALREALGGMGVALPDELVLDGEFSRGTAFVAVREALVRGARFDAVVAFNDRSAFGALDALMAAGLRVPEDVVVVGFDDDDLATLASPTLTTVDQNLEAQGELGARLLLELMAGRPVASAKVPVDLRRRETTRAVLPSAGTRSPYARLMAVDRALEISRAVLTSATVEDVLVRLRAHLPSLGVGRAFVVLRTTEGPGDPHGVVALKYYDGTDHDVTGEPVFALDRLLPEHLEEQLRYGTLVVQPLAVGDVELGHLVLDQPRRDHALISETLGMDLSRALGAMRATSRLNRHTEALEALVAERTQQLVTEAGLRRQAEAELMRVRDELRASLHIDGLTGISNRSAFDNALAVQWAQHSRSGQPLSVLMIDVDHFKAYNARYGVGPGDEALRAVAGCLKASVQRLGDVAARYGGEEFALLLPNTGAQGALVVANRVRRMVAKLAIEHLDSPVGQRLTISIGAASTHADPLSDARELVTAADAALYDVKDAGRDGIACSRGRRGPLPPDPRRDHAGAELP